MDNIIKRPIITEKSLKEAAKGIFTFEVDRGANKYQIAQAVESLFKVHAEEVKTITKVGKKRYSGKKRIATYSPDSKKAMITVKKGEKIDLFEISENK